MEMTNKSLQQKFGSKQKDGGAHVDVLRQKSSSAADWDWKSTTGPAFRLRGQDGVFELTPHGKEKIIRGRK
jgi:hypothetical protein